MVTLVAIAIVDKVGRKPMLLVGSAGMAVMLATMAVCFSQSVGSVDDITLPGSWGNVALVAANLVRGVLRRHVGSGGVGPAR